MKPKPQRIQLKRTKGFNLQAASLALNGLPAVNCARPSKYGNPHKIGYCNLCGKVHKSKAEAVQAFSEFDEYLRGSKQMQKHFAFVRGKNLACWCKPDEPCHCDVLLELANKEGTNQ